MQQAAPAHSQRWRAMLLSCWRLLQRSLWPLVVAHGVTDALVFLLHRLSHRATNEGGRWQFATQTVWPFFHARLGWAPASSLQVACVCTSARS